MFLPTCFYRRVNSYTLTTNAAFCRSFFDLFLPNQGVGQTASFLGDSGAARAAAARIFALLDRKPPIDSADDGGQRLPAIKGSLELRSVAGDASGWCWFLLLLLLLPLRPGAVDCRPTTSFEHVPFSFAIFP